MKFPKSKNTETPEEKKERMIKKYKQQLIEAEKVNTYFEGDSDTLRTARESQKEMNIKLIKENLNHWENI